MREFARGGVITAPPPSDDSIPLIAAPGCVIPLPGTPGFVAALYRDHTWEYGITVEGARAMGGDGAIRRLREEIRSAGNDRLLGPDRGE